MPKEIPIDLTGDDGRTNHYRIVTYQVFCQVCQANVTDDKGTVKPERATLAA